MNLIQLIIRQETPIKYVMKREIYKIICQHISTFRNNIKSTYCNVSDVHFDNQRPMMFENKTLYKR